MREEKLLTIRDVSHILGVSEKEVIDLVDKQIIPAYKIGGVYLRFKRQQIEGFKKNFKQPLVKDKLSQEYSFKERLSDFFYFNDFYIFSILIIVLILVVIFRGY